MRNETRVAMLRIGGSDPQVVQFMDYPDYTDPNGLRHVQLISFARARLADANNQELFVGQVIARLNAALTPTSLAILARLLHPFSGNFDLIVSGTYTVVGTTAVEVVAEAVLTTHLSPSLTGQAQEHHLVPLEPR